ncbi:alkylation response protein AidB-like acyl-CoA dehydrogenase [Arthrobacter pigmenti]|uniref:Alkylation response protein AidB-like acyl-CoA dehydrogenase n=1 Tax=Arthrobacter pigmenti TaxID=271432 RepID=A0A846RP21_9MICC|nr:acyl-CoA dehydrogenase family protein [Arthrobacter pigmenti]NJC22352.1 alkylation response protein AidB-like acyl-CoA dehydrogenase [Arthrobacter pigmenti]
MTALPEDILPDGLLERFRGRAADYDARNVFCQEDFDELVDRGYLRLFCDKDDDGAALGMAGAVACQRRLAAAAPATALAVNMHLVWTAVARLLRQGGDPSLDFILREAAAGEVFAFGLSEPGNDSVLFDSRTLAQQRDDGAYEFTGTKIFTSLSPVWTRLGVFGKSIGSEDEELVHGFITRGTPGVEILEDWDTLGMRATQSHTTRLNAVVVPAEQIFRHLPVGPNRDPLIFAIFAAFETLISAVYTGIADRALELAVSAVEDRNPGMDGTPMVDRPEIRAAVADAAIDWEALDAHLRLLAQDIDNQMEHNGRWFAKLVALKLHATGSAQDLVEGARTLAGGQGYSRGSELSRLARDVAAGRYHPSSRESARRTVASAWLD